MYTIYDFQSLSGKSTKYIKKELKKLKHQIESLEESKRAAIQTTRNIIHKRDKPKLLKKSKNEKSPETQNGITELKSPPVEVPKTESIQCFCKVYQQQLKEKDESIQKLTEKTEFLSKTLKKQETNNNQLTASLRAAQIQLRDNRKSFEKYESILKENHQISVHVKELQESIKNKDEVNKQIINAAEELSKDLKDKEELNKRLEDNLDKLKESIMDLSSMNKNLTNTNGELAETLKIKEANYLEIKKKYEVVQKQIDGFRSEMNKSQSVSRRANIYFFILNDFSFDLFL